MVHLISKTIRQSTLSSNLLLLASLTSHISIFPIKSINQKLPGQTTCICRSSDPGSCLLSIQLDSLDRMYFFLLCCYCQHVFVLSQLGECLFYQTRTIQHYKFTSLLNNIVYLQRWPFATHLLTPHGLILRDQDSFTIPVQEDFLPPTLEDTDVDGPLGKQVVDVHGFTLSVAAAAAYGLGHGRVIVILGLCQHGREEDDVVGTLEVSVKG